MGGVYFRRIGGVVIVILLLSIFPKYFRDMFFYCEVPASYEPVKLRFWTIFTKDIFRLNFTSIEKKNDINKYLGIRTKLSTNKPTHCIYKYPECSTENAAFSCTEKTIFPFPFKSNRIWLW